MNKYFDEFSMISVRHPRAACPSAVGGGDPGAFELDSRLCGSDPHFIAYL